MEAAIHAVDPNLPVNVRTMDTVIGSAVGGERLTAVFLGGFAVIGIGILLADMTTSRHRAQDLHQRTGRLTQLIEELETFTSSLEAANQRSRASEAR